MIIGIAGLGLIGGSLAKSIKKRTDHRVLGTDINADTMALAHSAGAVDGLLDPNGVPECDIIMVALRPGDAVRWVADHASLISPSAFVVDMCGVKRSVAHSIEPVAERCGFRYIGGHPMAGRECSGFAFSSEDLFCGASMILTPNKTTDMQLPQTVKELFCSMGFSRITCSTPDEHDRIIAFTSQLAHIVSGAYVKSPEAQRQRGFSAGSFRDMTRVAQLDENMWTELFLQNRDYLCTELDTLIKHLAEYAQALRAGDAKQLCALLRDGREKKATAGGS